MSVFTEESAFISASVQELQDYLLSSQLFWRLTPDRRARQTSLLQLTPGNLLLSEVRLAALCEVNKDCLEIAINLGRTAEIRERWKSHWQQKIHKEYHSRLESWQKVLQDIASTGMDATAYRFQIRLRVILSLLRKELPSESDPMVDALDQQLKTLTIPSDFIWEPALAKGFPADEFWFLYCLPRK